MRRRSPAGTSRRDHGVENSGRDEIETTPQESEIEVSSLKYDLFPRQCLHQRRQIHSGERVDQVIVAGAGRNGDVVGLALG